MSRVLCEGCGCDVGSRFGVHLSSGDRPSGGKGMVWLSGLKFGEEEFMALRMAASARTRGGGRR